MIKKQTKPTKIAGGMKKKIVTDVDLFERVSVVARPADATLPHFLPCFEPSSLIASTAMRLGPNSHSNAKYIKDLGRFTVL